MSPRWPPGDAGVYNGPAAAAELSSAALLANRRTARVGGGAALATLLAVWPANIQAALDGGYRVPTGWMGSPTASVRSAAGRAPCLETGSDGDRRVRGARRSLQERQRDG